MAESGQQYKIGEAAQELGVETSVLRYWESEFSQLRPRRTSTGQRLYSAQDLELAKKIQFLLYEEKMTIAGARKRLAGKDDEPMLSMIVSELNRIRSFLANK